VQLIAQPPLWRGEADLQQVTENKFARH